MEKSQETGKCESLEKCIQMLNLMLDQEASAEEEAFMREHLECCVHCLKQFELEKEFRSLIKTKLQHKEVPNDLVVLIRNKISYSL